jgi:CRISPR-associated protein Csx10
MSLQQSFRVTLEQDVVLSSRAVTEGQHQCLDYLPGSTFLGVAAGRGYPHLAADDAWLLFHSGKVRFVDALPWHEGQLARPMPLSLHQYKGDDIYQAELHGKCLDPAKLFDPSQLGADPGRQPQQLRQAYLTTTGGRLQPRLGERMKTAIASETGRAAEGQLFGYQALQAGQEFVFTLQADDDVGELFDQAVGWLTGQARLGRSRSAQYGQVSIKPCTAVSLAPDSIEQDSLLTLWLLSDMALVDGQGQPCLQPAPELLGLPADSKWLSEYSFLRSRRYSPYNAKRRSFDPEREVICRGSVLRFELPRRLEAAELDALKNLGLYQEAGLGQLAVNPKLLSGERPVFEPAVAGQGNSDQATPLIPPNTPLIKLLQSRAGQVDQLKEAAKIAEELFDGLCAIVCNARTWQGLRVGQPLIDAPGRSQWGLIKSKASDLRQGPSVLWESLFEGENAMIRERSGWGLETGPDRRLDTEFIALCQGLNLKQHVQFGSIMGRLAVLGLSAKWQQLLDGTATSANREVNA